MNIYFEFVKIPIFNLLSIALFCSLIYLIIQSFKIDLVRTTNTLLKSIVTCFVGTLIITSYTLENEAAVFLMLLKSFPCYQL